MVTRKSASNSARTGVKTAGRPTDSTAPPRTRGAAADNTPSAADLDLRDRLKAGPRRPAGPPLVGDIMTRAAMDALRDEVVPEPTEPKNRRARK
ncbi:MAG: hypothetical protein KGJ24_01540 [Burkholderiales bacterium]|nr:hypothetical protein [Burkholderiales bacterium]MDE2564498.1 hypothetical protein [Burkholderiales bacterium]